jgi:hypothetical protein
MSTYRDPGAEALDSREVTQGGPAAGLPAHSESIVVRSPSPLVTWTRALYLVLGVVEGLIAIRFVLKLLAANPDAGFAAFVYGLTAPMLAAFTGLLNNPGDASGPLFEVTSLVAMAVYALVGWLLVRIVGLVLDRTVTRSRRDIA